ncbi:MAG: anhydro-N-acetylmuramic acid kinase [Thermoanaerobaculia bacterium]
MPPTRMIAGCMTGTSLDGLDAVLTETKGRGFNLKARFVHRVARPLGELGAVLRRLASGEPAPAIEYARAARRLGKLHAEALEALCREASVPRLDLIAAHGQTICHAPAERLSFQLLDPWPMARRLLAPVVLDLRQADLAARGEGAPITPLADWLVFRQAAAARLVVNLGGIASITHLPAGASPDGIAARDVGPCNLLIDGVARALDPALAFDQDGRLAARGTATELVWERLQALPSLAQGRSTRSLGREDFQDAWIRDLVAEARAAGRSPEDIIAGAVEAVARLVALAVQGSGSPEVVLAGGGARNPVLVDRIRASCTSAPGVVLSDTLGVPAEAREGLCLAVLGALAQDGFPITLPQVTGARAPGSAGAWVYP